MSKNHMKTPPRGPYDDLTLDDWHRLFETLAPRRGWHVVERLAAQDPDTAPACEWCKGAPRGGLLSRLAHQHVSGGPLVCTACEMALTGASAPALEDERYKDGAAVARSVARARFLDPVYHHAVHERGLMVSLPDGVSALFARLPERGPGIFWKMSLPDEETVEGAPAADIECALKAAAREYALWADASMRFGRRALAP